MNKKINEGAIEKKVTEEEIKKTKEEIMTIRQDVYMMGANDYEIPAIDRILDQLEKREVLPNTAVEAVRKILISKQDYH